MFLNASVPPAAKRRRHRRMINLVWFTLAVFLIFVAFFDTVAIR